MTSESLVITVLLFVLIGTCFAVSGTGYDLFLSQNIPYPACISGSTSYTANKKCLKIARTSSDLIWSEARETCQEEGGNLVVIKDESFHNFIKESSRDLSIFWIGSNKSYVESEDPQYRFRWVDGHPMIYSNWGHGQPDYESGGIFNRRTDVCVELIQYYGWNDNLCRVKRKYICEYDFRDPVFCPGVGWELDVLDKMCYKIETAARTFDDARARCQLDGGDLVTLEDIHRRDFVISLIHPTIQTIPRYWIGLRREKNDTDSWEWISDGSPFSNNSTFISFSDRPNEHCASINYRSMEYIYSDRGCQIELPYICHKEASKDVPLFECPNGYYTFISDVKEWSLSCLRAECGARESFADAVEKCQIEGGELFRSNHAERDKNSFITWNLLVCNHNIYWYNDTGCTAYSKVAYTVSQRLCSERHNYICQHEGIIKTLVDLNEIKEIVDGLVYYDDDTSNNAEDQTISSLEETCNSLNIEELENLHNGQNDNLFPRVSVIVKMNLTLPTTSEQNANCFIPNSDNECCIRVESHKFEYQSGELQTKISFPIDKLLCLCPKRVSHQIIETLKNFTTPKNDTDAPKKLCPCRCGLEKIDFNPTQEVLALMLSKIQKELKVDTQQLSSRVSRKISATDNRTGSQAIGYAGITICLLPLCLLVAMDMVRLYKFVKP